MDHKHIALVSLIISSFLFAAAGVSYKWFLALGFGFISFLWVTRLFKFFTSLGISELTGLRHPHIKDRRELFFLLLNGLFCIGTPIFFVLAIAETTLSNAYFVSYTMPAWTMLFAVIFLGEKADAKKLFAVAATIAGLFLIASPQDPWSINKGIIFALAAAFSQAGDLVTSRELKNYNPRTVSLYANFIQLVFFSIVMLLFFEPINSGIPVFVWPYVVLLGVLLGIGSSLYYYALHYIEASVAGIVSLSELVFALVIGFAVFNEIPSGQEFAGYLLILLACAMAFVRKPTIAHFAHLLRTKRRL